MKAIISVFQYIDTTKTCLDEFYKNLFDKIKKFYKNIQGEREGKFDGKKVKRRI